MNPVTGIKKIRIGSQDYLLRFTWAALSEIEQKFGDNPNLFNTEVVAKVAEAGFREYHPHMTAAAIMKLSPPLMPFVKDVQEALQWAYFGPEKPTEDKPDLKKNRPADGWLKRFGRRVRAVFLR